MNPGLNAIGYGTFDSIETRLRMNYQKAVSAKQKLEEASKNPNFRAHVVSEFHDACVSVDTLDKLQDLYLRNPRAFKDFQFIRFEKEVKLVEELTDFVNIKLPLITDRPLESN